MIAKFFSLHSMFLLTLQFTSCTYMDAIKTNQTVKDGSLVISKENNFALGFFSLGNPSFRYLGIWYHKVPEQTVVWVANRGHPINGSLGFLSINQYGNLVLYGDSDRTVPVWSANCSVGYTCEAQLLDSGNLVLVQTTSKGVVWQSFDYPTDTVLAGMKLGLNRKTGQELFLTSWRSTDDPATGDYSFKLYPNGSPQFFLSRGTRRYWRTASWPWRGQWQLYKESFVNIQDEVYFVYTPIDDSIILRIMVDHTGFLKVVTWHVSDHKWKEFWAAPKHQCDWYGKCGAYSTCEPVDITRYECACLPGYELKDARNWYLRDGSGGCVSKGLESSSVCDPGEGFVKVDKVLLPDSSFAVWVNTSMSRANCEKQCKMNCSCSAYAIVDAPGIAKGCITWHGELMDTTYDRNDRYDLYVRVDALELGTSCFALNFQIKSNTFLKLFS